MKRGQLFWGGALVLIGGLMLAGEMGVRLPNGKPLLELFWPILLVGFGIWILLGVFVRRPGVETASVELQGAREARLQINHGAGIVRLHGGASANEFLRGEFGGGVERNESRNGDRLEVRLRPANDFFLFPAFGPENQIKWDVSLNPSIPTALDLNLGANQSDLDLRDLAITDIRLKSGASETTIVLPARGRLNADFEIGAAALTVIVPDGVAIRARATMGAADFNVDRSRFPGNESPDFASADNAVDIRVKGGAAAVKIK